MGSTMISGAVMDRPRGCQWFIGLDTFESSNGNLFWRMACLNNATISGQLEAALKQAHPPLR